MIGTIKFDVSDIALDVPVRPAHSGHGIEYQLGRTVDVILTVDEITDALANVLAWLETAEHFPIETGEVAEEVRTKCEQIAEAAVCILENWTEQ